MLRTSEKPMFSWNGACREIDGKTLLKRGLVQFLYKQDALHRGDDFTLAFVITNMTRMRDGRLLLLHASELGWCVILYNLSPTKKKCMLTFFLKRLPSAPRCSD